MRALEKVTDEVLNINPTEKPIMICQTQEIESISSKPISVEEVKPGILSLTVTGLSGGVEIKADW